MVKIVLVRPNYHSVWEPLNLMYISSYLKNSFNDIEIKVFDRCFDSEKTVLDGCYMADYVGISGTTPQINDIFMLASKIRETYPETHLVAGGYGPALQPQKFVNSIFNTVIVGAGEQPLSDLIRVGKRFETTQFIKPCLSDIKNFCDADRSVVDSEKYIAIAKREEGRRVASVSGSRGCNSWCVFCADGCTNFWGRKHGVRNPENVVNEVTNIVDKFNLDFVKFADSEINSTKNNLLNLINSFKSNKCNIRWGANLRVDNIDESLCNKLYEVGCRETWFGVESGDPKILSELNKGISVKQISNAFKITKNMFIRRAYIMLGAPSESYTSIKKTEHLIDEIDPDIVGVSILCPYPGTQFYTDKYRDIDWSKMDEYSNSLIESRFLSNHELKCEQRRLLDKYSDKLPKIVNKKRSMNIIN